MVFDFVHIALPCLVGWLSLKTKKKEKEKQVTTGLLQDFKLLDQCLAQGQWQEYVTDMPVFCVSLCLYVFLMYGSLFTAIKIVAPLCVLVVCIAVVLFLQWWTGFLCLKTVLPSVLVSTLCFVSMGQEYVIGH